MARKDRIKAILEDIIEMEKRRNEQALGQLYALLKKEKPIEREDKQKEAEETR